MARGPVGHMGPWAGPKATVEGKPFLKTGPEGYHSRETIFKVPRGPRQSKNLKNIFKSPPDLGSKGTLQNLGRPYFESFTV